MQNLFLLFIAKISELNCSLLLYLHHNRQCWISYFCQTWQPPPAALIHTRKWCSNNKTQIINYKQPPPPPINLFHASVFWCFELSFLLFFNMTVCVVLCCAHLLHSKFSFKTRLFFVHLAVFVSAFAWFSFGCFDLLSIPPKAPYIHSLPCTAFTPLVSHPLLSLTAKYFSITSHSQRVWFMMGCDSHD